MIPTSTYGYGLVFLVLFFLRRGVSLATCDGPIDFDVSFWFVSGVDAIEPFSRLLLSF